MPNPHESAKPLSSYSSNISEPGVIYKVEAIGFETCVDGGLTFENEDWSTDLSFGKYEGSNRVGYLQKSMIVHRKQL